MVLVASIRGVPAEGSCNLSRIVAIIRPNLNRGEPPDKRLPQSETTGMSFARLFRKLLVPDS
jgi:hypothetical protein